ncbi:von Willebrand factor A domain-containing protein 5B1 isoform X1 [Stegostoma tigrinum]|uniref:von Willebrand factor A domain-containing protein 5B1 isoform X1 n=1 Tax=Stegostoma tigrinum TaxID=3053191 RepID=UPI00202B145E|nr:von Willebrand factor A domain-containing protein 5B1 isoform X1 [Stegostoma tigrinum]XP_048417501.1 von Willebrand factor A domain-containing protein 5B1 isoform X1 [Stegostoma tigrinum]
MPGLINRHNNLNLPLKASEVTSCMIGYSLGMSASLVYTNMDDHPVEALFIYPLDEFTTVVGFEAMISGRIITVQIKDKAKIDNCNFDSCNITTSSAQKGQDHFVLDEDFERTLFTVNFGIIPPLETVTVLINTSLELQTLPNGTVRLLLPSLYVPRVTSSRTDEQSSTENELKSKDRFRCGFTPQHQNGNLLVKLLDNEVTNPTTYDFSFKLEIRAPCLLSGVESPTHSIRADADPSAFCASSVMITLAEKHTFDRPVEIIIHPSEPHMPHILIESGDMTPAEYEQFLKGRNDFIKGTRKDPSSEKKAEIIRKRLNKDIGHNPVIMLNFCPDLKTASPDLRMAQGEFIFLIDCSGSMSGVNISCVKDAMLVVLKSLMSSCLFNIIGFGSTFRTLFPASRSYNELTLTVACDYIRKLRADMGGTNLLAPLNWIFHQPIQRQHPRLLFILTDGSVSNTGRVIELIRNHARTCRCYTFGIGQSTCRRLVQGLASASKGAAEFLAEGERLQPKMVKSLKKAMAPVLSDITTEWFFPATTEVLLSPVEPIFLYPGDRLIGYCIVCDTSRYHSNLKSDKQRRYSMMWSQESNSSVFYHSQEEESGRISSDNLRSCGDSVVDSINDQPQDVISINERLENEGIESKLSPRRRAFSTNHAFRNDTSKRPFTPSDPSSAFHKHPLRRAKAQQLVGWNSPESVSPWQRQFQINVAGSCTGTTRSRLVGKRRPSLLHQNCVSSSQDSDIQSSPQKLATGDYITCSDGSTNTRSSIESALIGNCSESGQFHHLSSTLDIESAPEDQNLSAMENLANSCKALISGLLCGEVIQWEVGFDLQSLLQHTENRNVEDLWSETIHHLAAKSIIRDFEQMAERECEIEYGSGRRYQLNAIHTSKACNIISKYTAFVPMYLNNNEYLPSIRAYSNTADAGKKWNNQKKSRSGSCRHRDYSIGLGRSQSEYETDGVDDGFSTFSMDNSSQSPCSSSPSSGWERYSFTDASLRSPSVSSQRSTENLFTARLNFSKTRMLTQAAKGFLCRSVSKMSESACEPEAENNDYLPLINLQLASGAFLLNLAFCEAINIPMEQLKWTSPFTCHRSNASPGSHVHCSTFSDERTVQRDEENGTTETFHQKESGKMAALNYLGLDECRGDLEQLGPRHFSSSLVEIQSKVMSGSPDLLPPAVTVRRYSSPGNPEAASALQTDSGRGSETDSSDISFSTTSSELQQFTDPEGTIWSTAVALAWLEHSSAAYFIEWELVAAKASMWLDSQLIPEGRELATVKASARQLFVLLRHWDENLQLNMLCYNPNSV